MRTQKQAQYSATPATERALGKNCLSVEAEKALLCALLL